LYIHGLGGGDRARPLYQAEVVAVDGYLDLAVLRIVAHADGVPLDPSELDLTPVALGSSRDLRPLDELTVAGFPGIAESFAVRFSRGELHNFSDDSRVGRDAWLHTDAKISGGNSGGMAVDSAGQLVAIPTQTTRDSPDGAIVDFNMRPVELALPLIEAAQTGGEYDEYQYLVRPSGRESARVAGWAPEPSESCVAGVTEVPFGTQVVYPQIQFDGMEHGDHVLVELIDYASPTGQMFVRDFRSFDWPLESGQADCLVFEFRFDNSFPSRDYGLFLDGEYGVRVSVGPSDEREISPDSRRSAVRVAPLGLPGPEVSVPGTDPVAPQPGQGAQRPDPAQPSGYQAEKTMLRSARNLGFNCRRWNDEGVYNPEDYDAYAAIRCTRQDIKQVALFKFADGRSLEDYWRYRVGEIPGNLPRNARVCWNGKRGVSSWAHGAVACYTSVASDGSRVAKVRWTDERSNTYGLVDAKNGDLGALFEWWRGESP